jgi:hypothetical protein
VKGPAAGSLRLAMLSPVFWPEVRRGGERMIHELSGGLIMRGTRTIGTPSSTPRLGGPA